MCVKTTSLLLLLSFSISLSTGHLFVDSSGRQELAVIENQPIGLPNTTEITDTLGTLNVIQELRRLQAEMQTLQQELQTEVLNLQQEIQALNSTLQAPGCTWQGVYCDCYLEDTQDHAAILIGSSCENSSLEWTRVLDMHITSIIGNCLGTVNSSMCDGFF